MTGWEKYNEQMEKINKMSKIEQFNKCFEMFATYRYIEEREENEPDTVCEEDIEYKFMCEKVIDSIIADYDGEKWAWKWHNIYDLEEFKEKARKKMKID